MIKGLGYFALFVFLLLCLQIEGFGPGFAIWFLSMLLVFAGSCAFAMLEFPRELEEGILKQIMTFAERDHKKMIHTLDELANTIRKDGLLAVEGVRRDIKDPFLRYLLKRVVGGFEKNQIGSIIRNQFLRSQELFTITQSYADRVFQAIPVVGLIGSLFQIMDFLIHSQGSGKGSIGVVFIPFVLSLLAQLLLQSFLQERIIRAIDGSRLYYMVLEEGIHGIQDGVSPELLRDKLQSRLSVNIKWTDT